MDILNRYKIIGEPMLGGMGKVFHLKCDIKNDDLAMKQPLEKYMQTQEQKEMFVSECEKWMSLGVHPNIVQCYYVGEIDNKMSALMEWMPSGTLKDIISSQLIYRGNQHNRLLLILEVALQIAIGLRYSHSKGLLHLDVKPANVLIGENWSAKISDFGISNYLNKTSNKSMYTPLYCAPEQKQNQILSEATDIYCFGVTLLHLICGQATWYDGVAAGLGYRTILKKYAKIQVSDELQLVLEKCLQINPKDRFSSFEEVVGMLGKCWDKLNIGSFDKFYPEFYDNDANALNNAGVSYFNLNNSKKAALNFNNGYNKHPYHHALNLNYRLYSYLFNQSMYNVITNLYVDYVTKKSDENYYTYLQSLFSVSTLAYEKAKTQAFQVKSIYPSNYDYISKRYNENGPKIIFEMNLQNVLKTKIDMDCVFLGMIENNYLIYVSKTGKLTFIHLINKTINHGQSGMKDITHATLSQDGKYLSLVNENCISVYDLKSKPIKRIVNHQKCYSNLKQLCFISVNHQPVLLIRTDEMIYDLEIDETYMCDVKKRFSYMMNKYQDYYNIVQIKGKLYGFLKSSCICYDINTQEVASFKSMLRLHTLQENTVRSLSELPYALFLNNQKGYTIYDSNRNQFICEEQFENGISQLFLAPDHKTMITLEKDVLRLRKLPNYSFNEKPCFAINEFKTTKEIMDQMNEAKKKEKETYVLLDDEKMNKKQIQENIRIVRDVLEYSHYLKLSGLAAYKLGFNHVQTRLQFTNQIVDYYPLVEGYFVDHNYDILLSVSKYNHQLTTLKDKYDRLLANIPAIYENIIGLSKDYCYIICLEPKRELKYRMIELEWIVDWGE